MSAYLKNNLSIFDNYFKKRKFLQLEFFIKRSFILFFYTIIKLIFSFKNYLKIKLDRNTKEILKKFYHKTEIEYLFHKYLSNHYTKLDFL